MAETGVPSVEEQKQLISNIEQEEESLHVYMVSKTWYAAWKNYVGLPDKTGGVQSSKPRGPLPPAVDTEKEGEDSNVYVDEKIWINWIKWYGLADTHELDRRNWTSDEKEFEICILSPYSGIVQNPKKRFDVSELTGYVEVQLRRIFQIPKHCKTRMWACEKSRSARFQLLLERCKEICFQSCIDQHRSYILALEVCAMDGTWPTRVPGEPQGKFDQFSCLVEGPRPVEFWEKELRVAVNTVFQGIAAELHETVTGVVETSKCVTQCKENDLQKLKDKLQTQVEEKVGTRKKLEQLEVQLEQQEKRQKLQQERLEQDGRRLESERRKLEAEKQKMADLNKNSESRVKLDIGGCVYTTSKLTLTRESDSMLAIMFSGRHPVKKEPDDSYFVDRDGTHFRYILNYLRDGGFREGTLPHEHSFLNELLTEAEFYQIPGLIKLLKDLVGDSHQPAASGMDPNDPRGHRKTAQLRRSRATD